MRPLPVLNRSRPGLAWLAVALLLAAGVVVVALAQGLGTGTGARSSVARLLDWQPALAWREPWRWWSAAWVHGSVVHGAQNLGGALLLAWLGVAARVPAKLALAWLLAWPLTQGGWLLGPELAHFFGLSGVLHAGVAILGLHLLCRRRERLCGLLMLAGLGVKLMHEQPLGPVLRAAPELGIAVAPWSHLSGSIAGLLAAALVASIALAVRRRPSFSTAPRTAASGAAPACTPLGQTTRSSLVHADP